MEYKSEWWPAFSIEDHISSMKYIQDEVWVGSQCGEIAIFDLKGEQISKFKGHKGEIRCMVELDGKMYSAGADGLINQWNVCY